MTGWAAFWLCVAVFILCECILTMHGIDTFLWQFRTPAELDIQKDLSKP
jgi:hypothetical protein